ncbi:MAG: hypothetical protein R2771_11675 [Saprospiraceae bacterium]
MKKGLLFLLSIVLILTFSHCIEDGIETPESEVATFDTSEFGEFNVDAGAGIQIIPGTVPANNNGEVGSVSFSIETQVESPRQLNTGASFKNDLIKFGPENLQLMAGTIGFAL